MKVFNIQIIEIGHLFASHRHMTARNQPVGQTNVEIMFRKNIRCLPKIHKGTRSESSKGNKLQKQRQINIYHPSTHLPIYEGRQLSIHPDRQTQKEISSDGKHISMLGFLLLQERKTKFTAYLTVRRQSYLILSRQKASSNTGSPKRH